jgi:hypothetical protein
LYRETGDVMDKTQMAQDDEVANAIRTGALDPDQALQLLKDDKVLVWDGKRATDDWGGVEDAGASSTGIHHALAVVGSEDRSDEFSAEIQRLRDKGLTMESLDQPEG